MSLDHAERYGVIVTTPSEGGCLFCGSTKGLMLWSCEWDAAYHLGCARRAYQDDSLEAQIIADNENEDVARGEVVP